MRKLLLLLIITVAGCLSVACEAKKADEAAAEPGTAFTIREVMQSMVAPNADALWNAVSTSVTDKGIETKAPSNEEEWANMRHAAVTISEAMNTVLVPGRKVAKPGEQAKDPKVELTPEQIDALIAKDRAGWTKFARELQKAMNEAITAIDAKSADGLSAAGANIDAACENCHKQYWYPNDTKAQESQQPQQSQQPTEPKK